MHILIADDHEQDLQRLKIMLEAQGWKVRAASNGEQALNSALAAPPAVIISDVLMPVMDGFSLCRAWRRAEQLRDIPFILHADTGTDRKDEELALGLGADRFVLKPIDPSRWPVILNEVLSPGARASRPTPPQDTPAMLQMYNEVLVRSLEQKIAALESAQKQMLSESEERKRAESALRESEARAKAIADHTPVGIFMADAAGVVSYTNLALQQVLEAAEPVIGTEWISYVDPSDRTRVVGTWNQFVREQGEVHSIQYKLVSVTGNVRIVSVQARPIRESGRVVGYVGSVTDLTERFRAEDHRALLEVQLRHAQKMEAVGTLAGGVAHDFNNILSAILGNVELARYELPVDHAVQDSLQEIRKASIRAQQLVRQILAFSRKLPVTRTVVHLSEVVDEAIPVLRAAMPHLVELKVRHLPDTPPVLADAAQLHQVITNLCTNAWQAMDGTPGVIELIVGPRSLPADAPSPDPMLNAGACASLQVIDSGKGIAPENIDRIFEPFFTTKAQGQGKGLGLPVVHGIVRDHGGVIRVESTPGMGTTFTVYLPTATHDGGAKPPPAGAAIASLPRGNGERILFVDDEAQLVYLAERFLQRIGYQVTATQRPTDAIETLLGSPDDFDLVVTDQSMPEMTGIELSKQLRAIRANLPILLASGNVTDKLRAEAAAAGIRDVFYKPSSVEDFCRVIHTLAAKARPS